MAKKKLEKEKAIFIAKKERDISKKKATKSFGKWGNLSFIASSDKYRTFTDMKWKTTIKFDEEERKKKTSKVKFKGIEPDEFSFKMRFSVFGGMNPLKEMNKIDKAARKGKAYRMIIGGKKYGKSKLVITGISRDLQFFDKKGNLWIAELQITMKEKP